MFKVEFIEASNLRGKERPTKHLHSSACQSVVDAYRENIWRHTALIALPGYASLTAHNWAMANFMAQLELNTTTPSQAHAKRADELMNQLMQGDPQQKQRLLTEQTQSCERFMARTSGPYAETLETVLKSVLILAWGTFETLVEDLHTGVLKENPSLFGHAQNKEFRFRSRRAFQKSYSVAFQDDPSITALLTNHALDALALIRNLLVHRSGIVDAMFINESAGVTLLAPFSALAEGTKIQVSGKTVLNAVDPALEVGFALIESVDDWIQSRATP